LGLGLGLGLGKRSPLQRSQIWCHRQKNAGINHIFSCI